MKEGATEESSGSSESEADVEPEMSMTPFPYQEELLGRAKERNTIVCLGTGTGKTFISVMLIKEMAHQVRETYRNGGKRTFFLVTTGLRVFLYFSVMRKPTSLKVVYRRSSAIRAPNLTDELMYQSNRSFNIPPPSPPGIPRAFDGFSCPGRREFD